MPIVLNAVNFIRQMKVCPNVKEKKENNLAHYESNSDTILQYKLWRTHNRQF
jgi:hypothetical protein